MSVKIRLARGGSKKRPFYKIVAADSRMPRDGRFLEKMGTYNPLLPKEDPNRVKIDLDRVKQHYSMVLNLVQKYKIDGIIATNTTISRPQDLMNEYKDEEGGISGQPLKELSNKVLSFLSKETNRELLLIGVGGISNAEDVYTKIKLGASLVQLYTALTFNGPQMINKIKKDLALLLKNDGYKNITDAVGIIHS